MHSLHFNQIDFYCGTNQKNVLKKFFRYLFEDKQFFLFLCLRTRKILSLGEFDELKSHLFLVHFSARFSSKKGQLICRNMKKLTNLLLAGSVEERRKSSRKMQQLVE